MRVDWKYLNIAVQWNIRLIEIKIGHPWSTHWLAHILINVPVTVTSQLSPLFVKPTVYSAQYIVHPGGGNAARFVCSGCGANYPYGNNPAPCAFCSVMKESGITIAIGHRTREWRWSDHGWAVKCDDYWIVDGDNPNPGPSSLVARFHSIHKARAVAKRLEDEELRYYETHGVDPSRKIVSVVEPYPLKPAQSVIKVVHGL